MKARLKEMEEEAAKLRQVQVGLQPMRLGKAGLGPRTFHPPSNSEELTASGSTAAAGKGREGGRGRRCGVPRGGGCAVRVRR